MNFEIQIQTAKGRYLMQVERTYAGESLERFKVSYKGRSLTLQSNRPLLQATHSNRRVKWQIYEGQIRNTHVEEATMTLFRIEQAIEAHMNRVEEVN